jgi:alpha-glucuronidase
MKKRWLALLSFFVLITTLRAEDGYRLWLRYAPLGNTALRNTYRSALTSIVPNGNSATIQSAVAELQLGLQGILGKTVPERSVAIDGSIFFLKSAMQSDALGAEGFAIRREMRQGRRICTIRAQSDIGLLYGSFHLLRLIGTGQLPPEGKELVSVPKIRLRLLNHWDNLDRHVERGYAGISIWNWHLELAPPA